MTQVSVAKPSAGVLPISASATQKSAPPPAKSTAKPATPRLKLVVRRLPPGLTQAEFENALGEEWKVGAGKVDWFQYKPGKVSKDPAKPSRPSRAYLHLVSESHIAPLSDRVRKTSFLDARNTANDPVLLGPPSLEFAPYARIPGSRVRKDGRQGTIDQDQEFIDFLQSLTNPDPKPAPLETAPESEKKEEVVTTTPLVQYIKEKKANKAKESAAPAKSSKHGKSEKESKPEKVQAKKLLQRPDKEKEREKEKEKERESQSAATEKATEKEKKAKADKATKEAVKAANKQAASVAGKASKAASPAPAPKEAPKEPLKDTAKDTPKEKETPSPAPARERRRERGDISAAAKILQRDLGLVPSGGRRRSKAASTSTDNEATKAEGAQEAVPPPPSKPSPPAKPAKETAAAQKNPNAKTSSPQPAESAAKPESAAPPTAPASAKPPKPAKQKQSQSQPTTSTATQAFLKHANPSQGVTEAALEAAFSPFGKVVKVEIDKKKGFGYVDFADTESLQRAIAASPVQVAQSQVVVLERKMNPGAEKSRGKGRSEPSSSSPSGRGAKSGGGQGGGGSHGGRGRGSKKGAKGGPGEKAEGK